MKKNDNVHLNGLRVLLERILKSIVELPWLKANAGGIFINDDVSGRLNLLAHVNFPPLLLGQCGTVAHGHCLCGRVAERVEPLHAACVDSRHDIRYPGMADHGHYVVPIVSRKGDLLGVYTVYVEAGHQCDEQELQVLAGFADSMALVIEAYQQQEEKDLADLILRTSNFGVMITDPETRILWVNRAFEQTTGYSLAEVAGKKPNILASGLTPARIYWDMWRSLVREGQWQGEIRNRRKNGEIYPEWLNIVALRDEQGNVRRFAGTFVDLSEIKAAEERIRELAFRDPLTGLPNRTWVKELLPEVLSSRGEGRTHYSVIMVDLDHFHEISNILGEGKADGFLGKMADRLRAVCSGYEIARMDYDLFLIASAHASRSVAEEQALHVARAIQEAVVSLSREDDGIPRMSSTLGCAVTSFQEGVEIAIKNARIALSYAKEHARGDVRLYDELIETDHAYESYIMANSRQALERGELFLAFQPQVDSEGNVVGAEALMRWDSGPGNFGLIPPDKFIGYMERRGCIRELGLWAFGQAVELLLSLEDRVADLPRRFRLSVNLSPVQFVDEDLADRLYQACCDRGVSPSRIELEITESALSSSSDVFLSVLKRLSDHGFGVALDDFGTGHSSISRLNDLPISIFKVDRSFVSGIQDNDRALRLVASIISMARNLGHSVVAEGVETLEQFELLKELGCDRFQGFLFSAPVPARTFFELLGKRRIPLIA